jgi:antitoxin CptB
MTITEIPPQLRWACRRGMLELDVLLGNFLTEAFLALTEKDRELFVQLLAENDQDLFTWLIGHKTPENTELARMVGKIRHHAQNRH